MSKEKFNVDLKKLSALNLYQLREVGSKIGVKNPTSMKTEELRNAIKMVVKGEVEPYEKIKSGRPHRRQIIPDEDWNKVIGFDSNLPTSNLNIANNIFGILSTTSSNFKNFENRIYKGIAKNVDETYFILNGTINKIDSACYLRLDNTLPYANKIRPSDYVECLVEDTTDKPNIIKIEKINNQDPKTLQRKEFDNILPCELGSQINFDLPQLQFFNKTCPIKLGQRVMIKGPERSGQTYLTNSIAKDLERKYKVVFFATSKRPEERIFLDQADYVFTTFDTLPHDILLYFELAYEKAKRLLENDEDVVLIIDDLMILMQNIRSLVIEKLDNVESYYEEILQQFKIILALSKNTKSGSLTIICAASYGTITEFNKQIDILDSFCNCHINLNHTAFMQGKEEFYNKDTTYSECVRKI